MDKRRAVAHMEDIGRLIFVLQMGFEPAGDMCPACTKEYWEKLVEVEPDVFFVISTCYRCGWIETALLEKR